MKPELYLTNIVKDVCEKIEELTMDANYEELISEAAEMATHVEYFELKVLARENGWPLPDRTQFTKLACCFYWQQWITHTNNPENFPEPKIPNRAGRAS